LDAPARIEAGRHAASRSAHALPPAPAGQPAAPARPTERVIDSRTLFGQAREVRIAHNGEQYSLRLTRLGKLILTK
jgi:hemin uptake protein HemP